VQSRLGYRVVFGDGPDWCWLAVVGRVGPFRYLYLPLGPCLASSDALAGALADVRAQARRLRCAFVRFEPRSVPRRLLEDLGATRRRKRQHEDTMLLRLDVDEGALWRGVKSGHRSSIRGAERRGVRIECTRDSARMGEFVRLLRETEQRASFFTHEEGYFDAVADELMPTGVASLYFATADGDPVAGVLVFDLGPTRYYAFAASSARAREVQAAPALAWRVILDAREMGKTWFDFWGAAPPDHQPDHPWAGITYFKGAFGAHTESYAGTWEIPAHPLMARLSSLLAAVRR
jgi:lipid II:glycine glycyltransferase (peptidoglycan interpeptide bridge formation enzyme)